MTFLWLVIFVHVIVDFVLQTDKIAKSKSRMEWQGYFKHGLALFACTFLVTHFYGLNIALEFSVLSTAIHLIFDFVKILVMRKATVKWFSLWGFLVDQAFHIYILVMLWSQFTLRIDPNIISFYSNLFPIIDIPHQLKQQLVQLFSIDRIIVIGIIYLYIIFGGAIFVRLALNCVFPKKITSLDAGVDLAKFLTEQSGRYIGILERALILTLVLYNSLPAVAFVLTAKSLARFRELDSKEFAEYYLIGTLISASVAVVGGILLKSILPLFG